MMTGYQLAMLNDSQSSSQDIEICINSNKKWVKMNWNKKPIEGAKHMRRGLAGHFLGVIWIPLRNLHTA